MTNKNRFQILIEFFMLTIGSIIAAFAIEEFLVPNTILDGGVIGIGIMINNLTKLPLSMLTIILNIPFLLFGLHKLGKIFIIKAAYCMIIFSLFVSLFAPWTNATDETFLAVCYGGVILGIGVGLIIKFGGCLDGTETVAIILNRKFGLAVGQMVLIMNLVIYSIAGILFGPDRAMYSLLTYFITSKVLDVVENGVNTAKAATIITDDAKEISDKIYQTLGRTVTLMEGEGLVSGKKVVLYCVITRFEVRELTNIINSIDTSAFVSITDVSEIIGKHIKKKHLTQNCYLPIAKLLLFSIIYNLCISLKLPGIYHLEQCVRTPQSLCDNGIIKSFLIHYISKLVYIYHFNKSVRVN
ncbi:YitT family protein [Butyribacter intestini]|mgnify:CR=1 FL=1|jgi:uncharacterized membrane-anchored protein YitT (DUF2179 family)|uniref:YitT family protein n=1 Tax=Butyribacter intestini TaxID=1703332 RepID=UPI0009E6C300|nr:YitT family protein [Butyribacter intestini]RHU71613.1 YitT family protein [Butyribacter intestini]